MYKKNISVLTQDIDLGTLKFLKFCLENQFVIKYLLIAPAVKKHPIRTKQDLIRQNVLAKNIGISFKKLLLNLFQRNKFFIFLKKKIYLCILFFFKKKYDIELEILEKDYFSANDNCFEFLTVVYSLEGIISGNAIKRFKYGLINIHPALLPDYRGLDGGLWALKEGNEIGVTAYLIDEGIDTGSIINFYPLIDKGKDLVDYINNLKQLKYRSYVDAINRALTKDFKLTNPIIKKSQNRGLMPENTLKNLYKNFKNY